MLTIHLSVYPHPETADPEAAVLVGGQAHTAPSTDIAAQEAAAHRLYNEHPGHVRLMRWDGFAATETQIASK